MRRRFGLSPSASVLAALCLSCAGEDPSAGGGPSPVERADGGVGGAGSAAEPPTVADAGLDAPPARVPSAPRRRPLQTSVDHVSGLNYTGILIEVDVVPATAPSGPALAEVQAELQALIDGGYLGKPDGVRVVFDEELPGFGPDALTTIEELDALVRASRSLVPDPTESYIHLLYVDGHFEEDDATTSVLGLSYAAANVVMFEDNVRRACDLPTLSGLPGGQALVDEACLMTEGAVLMHELGHVFGLVNNGVPMLQDHQDEVHGAHDDNPDCLMYYAAESSLVVDRIAGRFSVGVRGMPQLDAACLADLAAVARGDG